MTAAAAAFTTALAFIIGSYSADKEVCDLALGFEILVASLWVTLLNVRSHLFIYFEESGIRSPPKQTEKPRTGLEVSKVFQGIVCLLFHLLFFFLIDWVCFSIFSSRNVLEAQCVFCLFKVKAKD